MNEDLNFYKLHEDYKKLAEVIWIQCDRAYDLNYDGCDASFIRAWFIDNAMKRFLNANFGTYCNMSESERNSNSERLRLRFN